MSRLRIYADTDAGSPQLDSRDHAEMARELATIGVGFEQWEASHPVVPGASSDEVLAAYRNDVDRLVAKHGFRSVDVVSIKPDHPDRTMMRTRFLDEHFHKEDEVRFFVAGAGQFTLHVEGKVYEILCETGDLIHVPDGTMHWFDMGRLPSLIAIRFFTEADGWVGHFTGNDIAQKFPFYEP